MIGLQILIVTRLIILAIDKVVRLNIFQEDNATMLVNKKNYKP